MNSREKGKRGEREWADFLNRHGLAARRGQQFNGLDGEDVVCDALPRLHFEVKRVERLNLYEAFAQARRDSHGGRVPILVHRRNRGDWLVVLRAEDALPVLLKLGETKN